MYNHTCLRQYQGVNNALRWGDCHLLLLNALHQQYRIFVRNITKVFGEYFALDYNVQN